MIIPDSQSFPKSPNHLHQHRWLGRHERPVPRDVFTRNQRGWRQCRNGGFFLEKPIGVIVGQMWRNSNLRFFLEYACDIHNSIILVGWFFANQLNNYAQVELDRFLKDGDFSQNCLETTTTCDQSLPSLPAKSEDKSPTSSKQGGNLPRIGNQLWVYFLTSAWNIHRNNEQIPPTSNSHEIGE